MGEFTCSRANTTGSSWAVQSFVVPAGARTINRIDVGIGARDGFTISVRRGGVDIGSVRAPGGIDEILQAGIGPINVNAGEWLELWVGDADGWTNNGSRLASKLFSVVRTTTDAYAGGAYRTTNNCPGQAPGAQTLPYDMQARIIGST